RSGTLSTHKHPPPATTATLSDPPRATDPAAPPQPAADLSFLSPAQGPGELGRLGGYRVLELLGRGGMGGVVRAEDTRLERQVALKVVRPEFAANAGSRRRFLREARMAARLEHDHVVRVYHADEAGAVAFLAMELLRGESLQERLNRAGGKPLPLPEAVR